MKEITSYVGWVDLSEEDQKRAREFLRQMKPEGTLDELGFGILRDAFAEIFCPATNTIMTRTRYLLFIPALYLTIEKDRLSGDRAARRFKELENQLRGALENSEEWGIIGKIAKEKLVRYPSAIYWRATAKLGIFRHPKWGQSEYHARLAEYYRQSGPVQDDDGVAHTDADIGPNWDPEVDHLAALGRGKRFLKNVRFDLTSDEARYLKKKYASLGESLLSHLIEEKIATPFRYPWEAKHPSDLHEHVKHAKLLSMLAKGITLHYYHLLCQEQQRQKLFDDDEYMVPAFKLWWTATRNDLRNWRLEDFFSLSKISPALRDNDREFFRRWLDIFRSSVRASEVLRNDAANGLIHERERIKRHYKSRLAHLEFLRLWHPPESLDHPLYSNPEHIPYWLDYRSPIGQTIVTEILRGLKGNG